MLILAPHLDDAVLSVGQFMSTEECYVVTVFAGSPSTGCSDYDRACGFSSSTQAMTQRRAEDKQAVRALGGTTRHLAFLDRQYGTPADDAQLVAACAEMMKPTRYTCVPLGIGHPDHVQLARCARAACPDNSALLLYEELPYRVLWPEQAAAALDEVRAEGFIVDALPHPLAVGDPDRKRDAVAKYVSQFPDGPTDPCLFVPERVWRASRIVEPEVDTCA